MNIDSGKYVPVLKWRQGEYQALLSLKPDVKEKVVPLLVIPPREYDFEEERMKKTVHEHVETFPKRLFSKWGARLALVDIHQSLEDETMDDGRPVIDFILREAYSQGCRVRAVVGLSKSPFYLNCVRLFVADRKDGVVLRVKLDELLMPTVSSELEILIGVIGVSWEEVDLVVDLVEPANFEPYGAFSKAIAGALSKVKGCKVCRSLIFVGTSLKLVNVKKPGATQKRHEWALYPLLRTEVEKIAYAPSFGDYTIESPSFISMDMRKMKPAGKIVYTIFDSWLVPKGGAFRKNEIQMIDHCKAIIASGHYSKSTFSKGDERIEQVANKLNNCGNLTTWKWVGVNHHITFVVRQLSSLYGT